MSDKLESALMRILGPFDYKPILQSMTEFSRRTFVNAIDAYLTQGLRPPDLDGLPKAVKSLLPMGAQPRHLTQPPPSDIEDIRSDDSGVAIEATQSQAWERPLEEPPPEPDIKEPSLEDTPVLTQERHKAQSLYNAVIRQQTSHNTIMLLMQTHGTTKTGLRNFKAVRMSLKATKEAYFAALDSLKKMEEREEIDIPKIEVPPNLKGTVHLNTKEIEARIPQCGTIALPASTFPVFIQKFTNYGISKKFSHDQYLEALEMLLAGEPYKLLQRLLSQKATFRTFLRPYLLNSDGQLL